MLTGSIYMKPLITDLIPPGKHLYLNGLYPDGVTKIISKVNNTLDILQKIKILSNSVKQMSKYIGFWRLILTTPVL